MHIDVAIERELRFEFRANFRYTLITLEVGMHDFRANVHSSSYGTDHLLDFTESFRINFAIRSILMRIESSIFAVPC